MKLTLEATKYQNLYRASENGMYYFRKSFQGKAVKKSLGTKDLSEAIGIMATLLSSVAPEENIQAMNISWDVAVQSWLSVYYLRPDVKDSTKNTTAGFAKRALRLVSGDVAASAITIADCRRWWAEEASEVAPRTANGSLCIVNSVFDWLVDNGSIKTNPAATLKKMRLRQAHLNIPSKEQFKAIIQYMNASKPGSPQGAPKSADMIEFLAYSGLRIEEARRLLWSDISHDSISVPDIKHATHRRTLYINEALHQVIHRIKTYSNGASLFDMHTPRKALERTCLALGIPHVRIHDLRHFFATSCIENGVDIPTIAKWLGHKDGGALAMRVYGHLRDEHSKTQAARLRF